MLRGGLPLSGSQEDEAFSLAVRTAPVSAVPDRAGAGLGAWGGERGHTEVHAGFWSKRELWSGYSLWIFLFLSRWKRNMQIFLESQRIPKQKAMEVETGRTI